MRSTPLTSCSIGVATVSATVLALAPGYVAVTARSAGPPPGYWRRQASQGDDADDHDHDRQHRGEDRPVDEEACEHRPPSYELRRAGRWLLRLAGAGPVASVACDTLGHRPSAPAATRWMPFTMTHSPGFRPSATTRRPFLKRAELDVAVSTTFWSFTTSTYFGPGRCRSARSVTSKALLRIADGRAHAHEEAGVEEAPGRWAARRARGSCRCGVDPVVGEIDHAPCAESPLRSARPSWTGNFQASREVLRRSGRLAAIARLAESQQRALVDVEVQRRSGRCSRSW